jgi:hypothetical protein
MVTRNPNNLVAFGKSNYGAPVSYYTITVKNTANASLAIINQTNPGEAMEYIVRAIALKGTLIAIGTGDNGATGVVRVAVENSDWTAATLQTALGVIGTITYIDNITKLSTTFDMTGTTVADFVF